jgi:glutaredoxin
LTPAVRVYSASGCHLCEIALAVLERVRADLRFDLEIIDITGEEDLERRYRERIPVVEIAGEEAFTYFVHEAALRSRLAREG